MSKNLQFVLFGFAIIGLGLYYDKSFGLLGLILLAWPVLGWLWKLIGGGNGETQLEQWLKALPETKYKYGNDEHGIALDEAKRVMYLFTYGYSKSYPFSDIREWTTNLASGGMVISSNIAIYDMSAAGRANREQKKENDDNSGLFISVKDIDHPEWRIKFSKYPQDEERLQKQWMEIFRQVVNKS